MSIFVCGDIHSTLDINKLDRFIGREDLNENDYLIICGDTGICGFSKEQEAATRAYLRGLPMTVLFADGNHEQFDALNSYSVDEWNGGKVHKIADNIIHLMRGQVFDVDGIRFFTMGGASSHDIDAGVLEPSDPDFTIKRKKLDREMALYRISRVSWWAEELPSEEEMAEGLANLERVGNKVDVILTHCMPSSVQDIYSRGQYKHDRLTDYLDIVKEKCEFKMWFFGHYHENRIIGQRFTMLYKEKIRLDDWLEQV